MKDTTTPSQAAGADDNMVALRGELFSALRAVRNGTLDVERARYINEMCKTIVDTGRLEVDYLKVSGGGESQFLESTVEPQRPALPPGITSVFTHKLAG